MTGLRPYRVRVTVRNNLLCEAIERAGYKSHAEFARANGINEQRLSALVAMRDAPIGGSGEFIALAKELMEIFGACPTDLWTAEQLTMKLKRNTAERAVSSEYVQDLLGNCQGVAQIVDAEEEAIKLDRTKAVDRALTTLTPREERVLRMRFGVGIAKGDMSLEEVGRVLDVTRERVRQIEMKALRRLRHPSRSAKLLENLDSPPIGESWRRRAEISNELHLEAEEAKIRQAELEEGARLSRETARRTKLRLEHVERARARPLADAAERLRDIDPSSYEEQLSEDQRAALEMVRSFTAKRDFKKGDKIVLDDGRRGQVAETPNSGQLIIAINGARFAFAASRVRKETRA